MNRLQITTKIGCSIACTYCPQEKLIKAYRDRSGKLLMSLDDFQLFTERIPPEVEIWFVGMCEPWLNPECTEMILYAHKKGHAICVFTTLVGMNVSDIDLMESVPFGFFKIHLPSDAGLENIRTTDNYLNVLDKILRSNINALFHCHGRRPNPEVKSVLDSHRKAIHFGHTYQRSGNIRLSGRLNMPRKRGAIACRRDLRNNILLPNGDVLLCSQDYGMEHVLGNITSSSYDSLFEGNEFLKVRKGLKDESVDILCRHCGQFGYNVDRFAKVYNFPYLIDKCFCHLKGIRGYSDLRLFLQRVFNKLKTPGEER
jgi:hypothetical protein